MYRRENDRKTARQKDPAGVQPKKCRQLHPRRKLSPGPNFVWNIDGHDKLKLYGFTIHECIDGFSRRMLWLKVSASNKMTGILAKSRCCQIVWYATKY